MEKRRSINTKFWEDSWIESIEPIEKLLFLYLLTSPLSNILGIYQITVKRISFDTGLKEDKILNTLKAFESIGKVFYINNFIVIPNHLKNQSLNPNMNKGALEIFNNLPNELIDKLNGNGLKGFESLLNGSLKYEVEKEDEKEDEIKDENKIKAIAIIDFLNHKANKKFSYGDCNLKYIIARLNENYTSEQLIKVIELKANDWVNDPKMCKYLRPETLFNATKFQGYVNEYMDKNTIKPTGPRLTIYDQPYQNID